jgi:TPR repeat protein
MTRKQWSQLKRKAQEGDAEAQWEVGSWLEDGLSDSHGSVLARPDARAAVRWHRLSAMAGHSFAQINLGNCLSTGRGVRRDDTEALRWYKRALRQGSDIAPNNIATVYRDKGNNRRAMHWYRRAVAGGDGNALVEIGWRYYKGVGVKCDPREAVQCFRKAIASKNITQAGREDAMLHLGVAFHEGRGVKKSDARAIRWASLANKDDDHDRARDLIDRIRKERR